MREIKFRAWEKSLKQMIPVDNIDFEKKMINTETAWRMFDEIQLMQYTGLKDKDGKEIYEGDIDGSDEPMVVCFQEGMFGLKYSLEDKYFDGCIDWERTEIIGNVYEQPKLLEMAGMI
jgi:hypothetical protein